MADAQAVGDDEVGQLGEGRVPADARRWQGPVQGGAPARSLACRVGALELEEALERREDGADGGAERVGGRGVAARIHDRAV